MRGDKIPMLHPLYGQLVRSFPEPKILYILRNPFDVAASFQRRAMEEDQTWRAGRDYRAACDEWNASVRATREWSKQLSFYVVDYEGFFSGQADIARLAAFLGLDPDHLRIGYDAQVARQEETDRADPLTNIARQYVSRRADFQAYRDLLEFADRSRFPDLRRLDPCRPEDGSTRRRTTGSWTTSTTKQSRAVGSAALDPRRFRPIVDCVPRCGIHFGRLAELPYPSLVSGKLGAQAVNLGYGGARAPFYFTDHRLLALINNCDCAVIEFFSARGTATPSIEPRDHQSAFIRLRGSRADFVFADHLFADLLLEMAADELGRLAQEIQQAYLDDMAELLSRIEVPRILLWFSQRPPCCSSATRTSPGSWAISRIL